MADKKVINWDLVELYVKTGCSQIKIAKSLYMDRDTLRDRVKEKYGVEYSAFSAALQSEGEMLIEATQYQKALKGNTALLIWLGKIRCGQREPESDQKLAVNQMEIDQMHRIMQLEHENAELKAYVNKCETE